MSEVADFVSAALAPARPRPASMLRTRRPGSKADERQVSTREDNGSRGALQGWYHGAKSWRRASIRCHRIRLEYGANDGPIVDPLSGDIPNPLDLLVGLERHAATKPACGKWHSCAKAWHNVVVPYRRAGLKNCANDRPSAPFDICQAGIIADGLTAMLALRHWHSGLCALFRSRNSHWWEFRSAHDTVMFVYHRGCGLPRPRVWHPAAAASPRGVMSRCRRHGSAGVGPRSGPTVHRNGR